MKTILFSKMIFNSAFPRFWWNFIRSEVKETHNKYVFVTYIIFSAILEFVCIYFAEF